MRLLLDTRTFIWLINDDKRLGKNTLGLFEDISNELHISYFSIFEMTIKASIGKLRYDPTILEVLHGMGIELILPTINALKGYKILNQNNKDPFDNMLISISRSEKTTFVTSDQKILKISAKDLKLQDATN